MKKYIKSSSLYTNSRFGKEWGQQNHKIYIDGEYQTFSHYFRNEDNYRIDIITKYNEKSDMLVWEVTYFPLTGDLEFPKLAEFFETFYDAMDYVDSGELADMCF